MIQITYGNFSNPDTKKWFIEYKSTDGKVFTIRSNDFDSIVEDYEDLRKMEENQAEYSGFRILDTNIGRRI